MSDGSKTQVPQFGIIIPACNEAPVLGRVLEEMLDVLDPRRFAIAVGVNDSSDGTAEVVRRFPVLLAETRSRGYGHGCVAAIERLEKLLPPLRAYIFCAGDGATDPADVSRLVKAYEDGHNFVLGARTGSPSNWSSMSCSHVIANVALAAWCGLLAFHRFSDLAPLRLIDRRLFHRMALREFTYGWTIEAQIAAARNGASICEVPARERRRLAGEQKVSGVSWRRTAAIGWQIAAAGWRTRRRFAESPPYLVEAEPALAPAPRGS